MSAALMLQDRRSSQDVVAWEGPTWTGDEPGWSVRSVVQLTAHSLARLKDWPQLGSRQRLELKIINEKYKDFFFTIAIAHSNMSV